MIHKIINLITKNDNNKSLLIHSFLAFTSRIFAAFVAFFLTVFVSKITDQKDTGNFFIAYGLFNILAILGSFGLHMLLLKKVSHYNDFDTKRRNISNSLIIAFIFSFTIALLLSFNSRFIADFIFNKKELDTYLFYFFLAFPFQVVIVLISNILQAEKKTILSISVLKIFIPSIVIIIAFTTGVENGSLLSKIYLLSTFATALLSLFSIRKMITFNSISFSELNCLLIEAKQFFIINIFQQISIWSAHFISSVLLSSEDIAILSVCRNTTMLMGFILLAINFVSAPTFSKLYNESRIIELKKYVKFTNKILVVIAVPIFLLIVLFPRNLLHMFGKNYTTLSSIITLLILASGQFLNVITGSVGYLLLMTGNEKYFRNGTIYNGILSLVLGLVFIPFLGVIGAAISTTISLVFINIYNSYYVKKCLNFSNLFYRAVNSNNIYK